MPYKRSNGTWYAAIVLHGIQHRENAGKTRREALALEATMRLEAANGTFASKRDRSVKEQMTFKRFIDAEYREYHRTQNSSATWHDESMSIIDRHFIPAFGKRLMDEITAANVIGWRTKRQSDDRTMLPGWATTKERKQRNKRPISKRTVNKEMQVLSGIFTHAVTYGLIPESPFKRIKDKVLKVDEKAPNFLSAAQVEELLSIVSADIQPILAVAAMAGLRCREIFQLEWRDIDFENGSITVTPGTDKEVKSGKFRIVPMTDRLVTILREHRLRPAFATASKVVEPKVFANTLVFPSAIGNRRTTVNKPLAAAAKAMGLEELGMHMLRHTFCSQMMMANVAPNTVQEYMGHADLMTTLRYAHVSEEYKRKAIQSLPY